MSQLAIARGRPKKYSEYDSLYTSLPKPMAKRPKYINNIGIFKGTSTESVWIKIHLRNGGIYDGKSYPLGHYLEIKVGNKSSYSWKQLEEKRDELQGKADRGEPLQETTVDTFNTYSDAWLKRAENRFKDQITQKHHVEKNLKPVFGRKALNFISTNDVNNWIADKSKHLKPATVKRAFNVLRAIFNDAIKAGVITKNPCTNATAIRGIVGRHRFLQIDEVLALITKAEEMDESLACFVLWALHSGMRKSEILGLKWNDIRTLANGNVIAQLHITKSGKPRNVTCTKTMLDVLKRMTKKRTSLTDNIFSITEITLRRKWSKLRTDCGLKDITIHDLRRTHSTHLAASGVDLNTLATRLGHGDLTMLQRHYAAVISENESEAANITEKLFSAKG